MRGSVGVGFAVPINTAKQFLPRLEAGEEIQRPWMGIAGFDLDAATARRQGLSVNRGVLVTQVVPGGPAADAGIRGGEGEGQQLPEGGDVITAVDGNEVANMSDLGDRLATKRPGDTVRLTINRDGRERQVTVTLAAWPAQQQP